MTDRWLPATEEELLAAITDGRLDEGPHLDFKRELVRGRKANSELARDIAMFANDGGTLIYGVEEPDAGRYVGAPVALEGLRERIEQIAASRLHPPLYVTVSTIRTKEDPEYGYVVVLVPASAAAPHMVDERYYGRAGTTRATLSDTQVRSVLASRQAAERPILGLLDAEISRDPIPKDLRAHAHLHVVARPRFARDDLVLADVETTGGNWSTWFHKQLLTGSFEPPLGKLWSPDLGGGASIGRRASGAALHDYYMGQDRSAGELLADQEKLHLHEKQLLDLEVDEDGTLHLFCGRGSDTLRGAGEVLLPAVVAGLVLRVVQVAARVTEVTGYVGTWDFAVAITGLRGVTRHSPEWHDSAPGYSAEGYRRSTAADTPELLANQRVITDRLTGRLLRSLGVQEGIEAALPRRQP